MPGIPRELIPHTWAFPPSQAPAWLAAPAPTAEEDFYTNSNKVSPQPPFHLGSHKTPSTAPVVQKCMHLTVLSPGSGP